MTTRATFLPAVWAAIAVVALAGCAASDRKPSPATPEQAAQSGPPTRAPQPVQTAQSSPLASANVAPRTAAVVTLTPSTSGPVPVGTSFYVTLGGVNMPKNGGATLRMDWDDAVVAAQSIELAPDSPFDGLESSNARRFTFVSVSNPNACVSGPCSFDAVRINFMALAPGKADITVADDNNDSCWGDPDTFNCVADRPIYKQADVTIEAAPPDQPK